MIALLLWLSLGLIFLIKGADLLVTGASSLAKKFNVSDLVIGLTVVAFGTSAPELIVNVMSSLEGHHEIVFANVVGSNNFNLFVILGITGLITPLIVQSSTVWKEIPISLFAIALLFLLTNAPWAYSSFLLGRLDGLILLILFAGFLFYVYKQLSTETAHPVQNPVHFSQLKIWSFLVVGLAGLVIGGNLVLNNAVEIANILGVSEKIIGLTIIAAGTSLPELATSLIAAFKKNADIAVGNIIGSNIFNIFLILGLSSLIKPIQYDPSFNSEMYLLAGGTVLLFIGMFTGQKKKLDRWEAALLLLLFMVYTGYLLTGEQS